MAKKSAKTKTAAAAKDAGNQDTQPTASPKSAKRKAGVARRGRPAKAARSGKEAHPKVARSSGRRGRTQYSPEQRQEILATAQREGLTANKVKERFGVTPVTYYSWRKKGGVAAGSRPGRRRGRPPGSASGGGVISVDVIRQEVRRQIQAMLPEIVSSEIAAAFGGATSRGRSR